MDLNHELKKHFGYSSFRKGQEEIIQSVLDGQDTLAVLPTGTGKSICYQLSGYLMTGSVLVISPLLSLMQDQVEQMKASGEKHVVAINSFLSFEEKRRAISYLHSYKFIYISPEMLTNEEILSKLKEMSIALFVIDEAHCISQWGPDFRPDYLKLGRVRKTLNSPVTLALSATATEKVRQDIVMTLDIEKAAERISSVDRPNIGIIVEKVETYDAKVDRLKSLISELEKPGIVYFSSKKVADEMARLLNERDGIQASSYHAGLDQEQRILIQQQFLINQLNVICATSAFGMGINKEDVRFVIHFHFPSSIESYLQEIGRAGRDGQNSIALLLYLAGDEQLPQRLIELEYLSKEQIYAYMEESSYSLNQKAQLLGLSEIHQRLLKYYESELKIGNTDDFDLKSFSQNVEDVMRDRFKQKQDDLSYVIQWAHGQSCRRESILTYFGENLRSNVNPCCDVCGVDLSLYFRSGMNPPHQPLPGWSELLQNLLKSR
ncbi:RecQ family ATP-dependent DNA helicase [Bacillus sp. 2205SS5-2]|uniref:RecQ family ATP-dependent DNA helicase n=1 Tax=Bacillus sp. 2205SS5-2 TaxID=3109031 RepID=UPI0030079738